MILFFNLLWWCIISASLLTRISVPWAWEPSLCICFTNDFSQVPPTLLCIQNITWNIADKNRLTLYPPADNILPTLMQHPDAGSLCLAPCPGKNNPQHIAGETRHNWQMHTSCCPAITKPCPIVNDTKKFSLILGLPLNTQDFCYELQEIL